MSSGENERLDLDSKATVTPHIAPSVAPAAGANRSMEPGAGDLRSRYEILNEIGRGGLGRVFLARDLALNRIVAVKELQPSYADRPEMRDFFLQEILLTAQLDHPSIIPVFGYGTEVDGRLFYVMRYVRGETLRQASDRFHEHAAEREGSRGFLSRAFRQLGLGRPFSHPFLGTEFRRLLMHLLQAAWAVAYAHDRCVIHRDLKPSNVLTGPYGETYVMDWGLARVIPRDRAPTVEDTLPPITLATAPERGTLTGPIGTPAYMSPEQANGSPRMGPPADVFGLGATLYHLLTNRPPFISLHDRDSLTPPRALNRSIPRALERICVRAMASRPEERFATALHFAQEIESWLSATD